MDGWHEYSQSTIILASSFLSLLGWCRGCCGSCRVWLLRRTKISVPVFYLHDESVDLMEEEVSTNQATITERHNNDFKLQSHPWACNPLFTPANFVEEYFWFFSHACSPMYSCAYSHSHVVVVILVVGSRHTRYLCKI